MMNNRGRPPKPENRKRHTLCVTISYEAVTGIRDYAVRNEMELSTATDLAIFEFLKARTVPAMESVSPTAQVDSANKDSETGEDLFELPPDYTE